MSSPVRVERDRVRHAYDPGVPPVTSLRSGDEVVFATQDARGGALLDRPTGLPYELPRPIEDRGNPVTGPIAVEDAAPGDALVVEIRRIELQGPGWCGGHAHVGPVPPGRIPHPVGRTCQVIGSQVVFGPELSLPVRPMIGCVGTAPVGQAVPTRLAGRHGGNMDQPVVAEGAQVWLPVWVPGALLSIGDVHAAQGDGELSGVALEIPAEVTVRVTVVRGAALSWPWVVTADGRAVVCTVASTWAEARSHAVDAALGALERRFGLEPGDALALVSLVGDLRPGGSWGGPQENARIELPAHLGVSPA